MSYDEFDSYKSIPEAFFERAKRSPHEVVYGIRTPVTGSDLNGPRESKFFNYLLVSQRVLSIACYLKKIGLTSGEKVAILSNTRPEWMEADLGILAAGGVVVSVYHSLPSIDIGYILYDSGAKIVFVENEEQAEKVKSIAKFKFLIPSTEERAGGEVTVNLTKIISFEEVSKDPLITTLTEILSQKGSLEELGSFPTREMLASLVYTSGTTGPPKGVMQTQGNHLSNVRQVLQSGLVLSKSSIMLILPLAHSFAKLMGYLGFLTDAYLKFPAITSRTSSKADVASITRDIRESDALIVPVVPRLLEKMQEGINLKSKSSGLSSRVLRITLELSSKSYGTNPKKLNIREKLLNRFASRIRKRIKENLFGRRFQYAISGGAKLPVAVSYFFDSLGIEILEGYGLTETCVATNANRPGKKKIGTVGPVLADDIEIKLLEDGEICFRGPNVTSGYLGRKAVSQASWDKDGWFHTGDIGSVDEDGYLTIRGRKKEIIVTSNGKNISPDHVEERIRHSKIISQVMVIGDDRPFLGALLFLNQTELQKHFKDRSESVPQEYWNSSSVLALVKTEIDFYTKDLPAYEHVRKFGIITEEPTVENGMLTPTFKLKRKVMLEKFAKLIEDIYVHLD